MIGLRVSIVTIAPACWSIRKTPEEFDTSYHMAKKAKDLKNSAGVLSSAAVKKGKNLRNETFSKLIGFYDNNINIRVIQYQKETVVNEDNFKKSKTFVTLGS